MIKLHTVGLSLTKMTKVGLYFTLKRKVWHSIILKSFILGTHYGWVVKFSRKGYQIR